MNKNNQAEKAVGKFWHSATGVVHSTMDCTSARRYKWDLIDITNDERFEDMPVSCKRCLKKQAVCDDKYCEVHNPDYVDFKAETGERIFARTFSATKQSPQSYSEALAQDRDKLRVELRKTKAHAERLAEALKPFVEKGASLTTPREVTNAIKTLAAWEGAQK